MATKFNVAEIYSKNCHVIQFKPCLASRRYKGNNHMCKHRIHAMIQFALPTMTVEIFRENTLPFSN